MLQNEGLRKTIPGGWFPVLLLVVALLRSLPSSIAQTSDPWTEEGVSRQKVSWLSDEENLLVAELNKARTDPARYAREYIEPELALFLPDDPRIQQKPDGSLLSLNEGVSAVQECIRIMKTTPPMGILTASEGISKAARGHARDMERRNFFDHDGSDGSDPYQRMSRYGKWSGYAAENISSGEATARGIVVQLLIDDGVPSRGHRENILNPVLTRVGVAIAPHKEWRWTATIDLTAEYIGK